MLVDSKNAFNLFAFAYLTLDSFFVFTCCCLNFWGIFWMPSEKQILSILSRWYHGRLDRNVAEDRLRQANQLGSYLIRESDRKPGSYVLSFYGKTGINHFRLEFF
jgi:hypothetical protein